MSRSRNYLAGLASGYVVTLATILVGLWLTPFTLRYLDREEFAVFTLAGDVLMWLGLLEIGLTAVLNVKAAQLSGKPDQAQLDRLASTTCFAQCGIALLLLLAGIGVTFWFPDFFALRPELHREALLVMALMVVASALTVATQTFSALLVAYQQMAVDNAIRLGLIAIRTGLTVWLLFEGVGLVSLAIAHLVAVLITGVLAMIRVRRLLPALQLRWSNFSWELLWQTGGVGIWFSLGGIAGILIMYLDRIVTARMVSVEMVTTLALTGRLYTLAWTLLQQITNNARPALAQIIGEGNMELCLTRYRQLVLASTGLALVAVMGIWAGNSEFVVWWVGSENYGGSMLDFLLALNLVVHAWILPNRAILVAGMAYVPQNAISRFIEGSLNLGLSIILGFIFGLKGIVVSTTIAGVLTTCWYFPKLTANFFKKNIRSLYDKSMLRLLVVTIFITPFVFAGKKISTHFSGLCGAISGSLFVVMVGAMFFWVFVCDREVKDRCIGLIAKKCFSKRGAR